MRRQGEIVMSGWKLDYVPSDSDEVLGFLQMCIERRFHRAVQLEFEKLTRIDHSRIWVETDVGGSPMMMDQSRASNYCYGKGVRTMGWSAHGATCGGFGPGVDDETIQKALAETLEEKVSIFPDAQHYALFATVSGEPPQMLIWHKGPLKQTP